MSIKAFGDIDTITEVSLIVESDFYDYKFTGKIVNGVVQVKIPKLAGIIESGTYSASLNVIADGDKFFQPYKGSVIFPSIGKVDVSETRIEDIQSDIECELIQEDEDEDQYTERARKKGETKFSKYFNKD
jgi:hypothetical protein